MDWTELRDLRIKLVMSDLREGPVPKYWERDVPPGIVSVADWHAAYGYFSDDEAAALLQRYVGKTVKTRWGHEVPVLAIITSEPWTDASARFPETIGGAGNNERPSFYRYAAVERVEVVERPKLWEWPDGELTKITIKGYVAVGEPYDMPDGRKGVRDTCQSGPERFERDGDAVIQYGAATALLARLLEIATD